MKTKNQIKPLARLIAASLAVGSMAGFGTQALAQTAAGTLIKNLATVTYEDEGGNSYSAQSNEAVVTVAPVYSATLENDNSLSGAPGQTVYLPHTLSNTGNTPDTFTVTPPANGSAVYIDANNNGQPDPGEELATAGPISVPAGEQVNLVVAVDVPTDAADGDVISTLLEVASVGGGDVIDTGDNADTLDGTNEDTVTVSTGPVLVLNKTAVHDEANNKITYTLTVKNNGGSDAANVNIVDALPEVDTDGDGTPDMQVTFDSVAANGFLNAGDVVPAGTVSVVEATDPKGDINFDNDTLDTLNAIVAKDVTLPPGTTVSVVYTIAYDPTWESGASVDNTFMAFDDPDDNGSPDDSTTGVVGSNTTNTTIPQTYGAAIDDTGLNADDAVNDGGDDDGTVDGTQNVAAAATGEEVKFQSIVTNDGNGDDTFNLEVTSDAADGFPPNTTFTFWDSTGTVQLTDTDNDGVPDTGMLPAGASQTIMIKANLPSGVSGEPANGYNATVTSTSSEDPSATPATDTSALKLDKISAPFVDIANVTPGGQTLTGFGDDGSDNAHDEAPVELKPGTVNGTVTFDLQLANESGSPDSFLLSSGNVPEGWDVVYKDASGAIITTTPLVPGGGVFAYTAEVTISADPSQAMGDSDQAGAVDGYDAADGPGALVGTDEDLDYQIDFMATSTSTPSVSDSVTNAIDVESSRDVVITPNGQNQVQPGGTVDFEHLVENNGNQTEAVELSTDGDLPGWTTVISVDTTGDGIPDTVLTSDLVGSVIKGVDADGNPVDIEVTDTDNDGIPEVNLEPGENLPIKTTVSAPANAPLGTTNTTTITAAQLDDTPLTTATDQATVMLGQVRLDKTASVDADCDGLLDAGASFEASPAGGVEPGECIIWNLTATNEGADTVKNVMISDAAPAFTDYMVGMSKFCQGNACTPVGPMTDASDADGVTYGGGLIKFFATGGATADPAAGIGGELASGEQMTGQFTVKIQ